MKMLIFAMLFTTGAFAQSIILEDETDTYNSVSLKYRIDETSGVAGIQATYIENNPEMPGHMSNFTFKGISYNKQTEEIVFDNGINEYVCARMEHKRFIFKYKTLKETGNCKLISQTYNNEVVRTDGIGSWREKVTFRRLKFVVINADQVETTNWNVQKWEANNLPL